VPPAAAGGCPGPVKRNGTEVAPLRRMAMSLPPNAGRGERTPHPHRRRWWLGPAVGVRLRRGHGRPVGVVFRLRGWAQRVRQRSVRPAGPLASDVGGVTASTVSALVLWRPDVPRDSLSMLSCSGGGAAVLAFSRVCWTSGRSMTPAAANAKRSNHRTSLKPRRGVNDVPQAEPLPVAGRSTPTQEERCPGRPAR
jgi:hypothetical protein